MKLPAWFIGRCLLWIVRFIEKKMGIEINLPAPAAPDPLAVATNAERLAAAVVDGAAKIEQQDNTPAQNIAAIEDHHLKVTEAAKKALDEGDTATLQRMLAAAAKLIVFALVLLDLAGCAGTFNRQRMIEDDAATRGSYDASTPPQYPTAFNSGLLSIVKNGNKRLAVITADKAVHEPTARPYTDKFGNHVFSVDGGVLLDEIDKEQASDAVKLENAK